MDADIRSDLGFYGNDAAALLAAVSSEFEIDMSNFRFEEHFESEGWLVHWFSWMLGERRIYRPLTVSMLVTAAINRRWAA